MKKERKRGKRERESEREYLKGKRMVSNIEE